MRQPKYDSIVRKFVSWADSESFVRSALIIGSQARSSEPADEWSDLDLVLFVRDPTALLDSKEWTEKFGAVILTFVEETAIAGSRERRVLYAGGLDVDFAVFPLEALTYVSVSPEVRTVLGRGYEVLLDKDGFWSGHSELGRSGSSSPDRLASFDEFQATFDDFWYHVLWTAKKIRRGEVWTAKFCCDGYLKFLLLRVIEWRALASARGTASVWHSGRFLEKWLPPDILARIPATFARYDLSDLERALAATSDLFSDVSRDLVRELGRSYPDAEEATVRSLVSQALAASSPKAG